MRFDRAHNVRGESMAHKPGPAIMIVTDTTSTSFTAGHGLTPIEHGHVLACGTLAETWVALIH